MALISVIQPQQGAKKESGLDKIIKGIQAASLALGSGIDIAKAVNDFKQTDLLEKKSKLDFLNNTVAGSAEDPNSFELSKGVWRKPKDNVLGLDNVYKGLSSGLLKPVDASNVNELTSSGLRLIPTQLDTDKQKFYFDPNAVGQDFDKLLKHMQGQKLALDIKAAQEKPTIAQQKVDEAFAKDYNEFIGAGGYADANKNLKQLEDAKKMLSETDMATGPFIGFLPKAFRDVIDPKGSSIQDKVEEVVQRNLRLVLGAQFTQKEGEMLLSRAYNPRQPESENIKRVDALLNQIKSAVASKQAAAKYYEEHGTLAGFKGQIITSIDQFKLPESKNKEPGLPLTREQKIKLLEQ